ncbi:MAG TPA: TRAM domain-containing protein, partial [Verrucomicrobiota bacterium]|nr:TRAM domain-containing protein [Verrucomicrobiota bacterium]
MEENNLTSGSKIETQIEDIAFGGEGVGRYNDFVVFVPFTIPGEKVLVEIAEVKKNFARAILLKILEPSPHRVEPLCKYFGDCGGCQYQHIAYPYQLQVKRKQIVDLLERIGGFTAPQVDEVSACPRPYQYRNKIMVRSQWDKLQKKLVIGFLRYDNRLVSDIQECKIAEPTINEQLKKVRENPPPRGGLKVMLRVLPPDWEVPFDSFFQNNFYALPILVEKAAECIKESNAKYLIDAYCGIGFFGISLANFVEKVIGFDIDLQAIKAAKK